jgi:small subunit ribosomal protein S3
MGQKVNPIGFRLKINKSWDSRWFSNKKYAEWLINDHLIRTFIMKTHKLSNIAKIIIERVGNKCKIGIHSSKPGVIIGRKGSGIESFKSKLKKLCNNEVFVNIYEIKKPDINAQLIANSIAQLIEKRHSFKRCMKKAVSNAIKIGVQGIKILCSGRLNGAEMARKEWILEGKIPLHTIRANIDYGNSNAYTSYGVIGCKVWLFKGEVIK